MTGHKFRIGQVVFFHPKTSSLFDYDAPTHRPFQVAEWLPGSAGEPAYKIKSAYEKHERLAIESELRPAQINTRLWQQHNF